MTALEIKKTMDETVEYLIEFAGYGMMADRRLIKLADIIDELEAQAEVLRMTPIRGTRASAWKMIEGLDAARLTGDWTEEMESSVEARLAEAEILVG